MTDVRDDLKDRMAVAIELGTKTGARGKSPTNIYNIAAEALARIEELERERDEARALIETGTIIDERRTRLAVLAEREAILAMLGADAPHSPRRYIYDAKPGRRIWATDRLEAAIRSRGRDGE